jgi:hypothetical protein
MPQQSALTYGNRSSAPSRRDACRSNLRICEGYRAAYRCGELAYIPTTFAMAHLDFREAEGLRD